MKKIFLSILIVVFIISSSYFFSSNISLFKKENKKLTIVTTIFPLYDFTRNITGDLAHVTLLLRPGIDPHSFEPKPSDIITVQKADMFIYMHPSLEVWASDIIKGINTKSVTVVNASKKISTIKSQNKQTDPHVWLDPVLSIQIVDKITDSIINKDKTNETFYLKNSKKYKDELLTLHSEFKKKLRNCQSKNIVYGGHYAFGYLAKRYNLNYIAAQGFLQESEPTTQNLTEIIDFIKKNNISFVFYEELENPRLAKTLSEETGVNLIQLNSIHTIEKNQNYLSLMRMNLENLKRGLMCDN